MKRSHFIILLLTGLSLVTNSQIVITTPYEFTIGGSGGATFSSVSFSPHVPQSKLPGLTFGLTGRMAMGKNMGLQLELNYAQQGWKEKYETEETPNGEDEQPTAQPNYRYNRLLNYVQLPFFTHVRFNGEKARVFFLAGPQIGYLLSESTNENLQGVSPGRVNAQHNLAVQKKFEWGISGGGGVEIRTRTGYYLIEGRYLYALGDIYNTRREDSFSKASGQTISVKLTWLIPLKKK